MGYSGQYNDIHIPVVFICMKNICYDFEDLSGISHNLMWRSLSWHKPSRELPSHRHRKSSLAEGFLQFEGRVAQTGILGTWSSIFALLWVTVPWKLRCFSSDGFSEISLKSYQTLKKQRKALRIYYYIWNQIIAILLPGYLQIVDCLSICQGILYSSPEVKYSHWHILSSGLLTKKWEFEVKYLLNFPNSDVFSC